MGVKRKQENQDVIFDEEDEAPAYVPPVPLGYHFKEKITGKILTNEARTLAFKIFGISLPGNPYIELNRIFSLRDPKDLDEHDKMLFERRENPVNKELIGKNLLLWNFIYRRLHENEKFLNGDMDDVFATKMTLLELKVTFNHNPSYPEYEHNVDLKNCRLLADFIGKPISKEQIVYGILLKKGVKYPLMSFSDFNKILDDNFVKEKDITKWNIFGKDVLRGHPLEHADPRYHCLATMKVDPKYKPMKVILADERLRLQFKITRNEADKRYEIFTYASMLSDLIGELYGKSILAYLNLNLNTF